MLIGRCNNSTLFKDCVVILNNTFNAKSVVSYSMLCVYSSDTQEYVFKIHPLVKMLHVNFKNAHGLSSSHLGNHIYNHFNSRLEFKIVDKNEAKIC